MPAIVASLKAQSAVMVSVSRGPSVTLKAAKLTAVRAPEVRVTVAVVEGA